MWTIEEGQGVFDQSFHGYVSLMLQVSVSLKYCEIFYKPYQRREARQVP